MEPSSKTEEFISNHRGYSIYKHGETSFEIRKGGNTVARCGSTWGCVVYIDELLSP